MGYAFDTRCIHGDVRVNPDAYGAVSVPIYQTATFAHPEVGKSSGYDYSRESNPTRGALERVIASLEGACDAIATSSGMSAIDLALGLLPEHAHLVCTEDLYGGTVRILDSRKKSTGLSYTQVDTADADAVEAAIRPETKALYIETPSNPTMRITDLRAMKKLAVSHGLLLIVDNTFLSPYFQKPISLGADIVVHSGTKFIGGHNDSLAGYVCIADPKIAKQLRFDYKTTGMMLSPFDSFLQLRGVKTLPLRMEKQQANAIRIAGWLKENPLVTDVYYIGLPEHPGYEVNRRQASGFGSMISFRVDSRETAIRVLNHVKLIQYAESLGGVESLLTYPMLQTHGDVPADEREKLGITDTFLRLSVGIEDAEDLIRDLAQAFGGEA
jgi:cystathionine gamma-synthase